MNIKSNEFIFVTGKAFSGKTYWIKKHLSVIPQKRLYILDFNANDYQEFVKSANVWNVQTGQINEIEDFLREVYMKGNCYVILSESDNYLRHDSSIIRAFVTTARNRGIGSVIDGKRPMSVVPNYRGRFNHLILFQTTLPEDIEYLESWCGCEDGRLNILKTLKQGQYLHVNLDSQEISDIKRPI